jgi:hypothetical protein
MGIPTTFLTPKMKISSFSLAQKDTNKKAIFMPGGWTSVNY